jgi:hypothetical protein
MSAGLSFESFAGVIGVGKVTLYSWLDRHPSFLNAKNIGLERGRLFWEKIGRAAASGQRISGFDPKHFNTAVWIFTMKNRFGWRDRTELSSDPERPLVRDSLPTSREGVPTEALIERVLDRKRRETSHGPKRR